MFWSILKFVNRCTFILLNDYFKDFWNVDGSVINRLYYEYYEWTDKWADKYYKRSDTYYQWADELEDD